MTRRELLRLGGSSLLWMGLPSSLKSAHHEMSGSKNPRLFFNLEDIPNIRANTITALMGPLFQEWSAKQPEELAAAFDKFDETGDIIYDFRNVIGDMTNSALVQLVQPTAKRRDSLLQTVRRMLEVPEWDYFMDGPDALGIQRASVATVRLLFVREVLEEDFDEELNKQFLSAIAEKGCLPCYRTIYDMENPEQVGGWGFNERHAGFYDINMDRWPMILGANNLRSAPTSALGIGALALLGHDTRADIWLETAIASTRRVLKLFTKDGSYFEGISYVGYTMRTSFNFMDAHQRIKGDIDWPKEANLDGMIDYIVTMQAGRKANGTPDIINFSDAKGSVFPCAPAWIGRQTGNPLAQYAAEHASEPHYFLDFLWYDPKRRTIKPPAALMNYHNDLDWIICRSGWEPNDAVLGFRSGGPANHEHADRNSFIYKIHGERLLNDHTGAPYDRRSPGWPMRLSRGHNCVLIDGKGHHYHDGIEGTNDSLSYANLVQYEDEADTVWWTSDATAAYRVENYSVFKVLRTVIFAKPNIIVVLDQVQMRYREQRVDMRFFPNNHDGAASLDTDGKAKFTLERPHARLHGLVAARSDITISETQLEVPADIGNFPCVEIGSEKALDHEIVTLMAATPSSRKESPTLTVEAIKEGWRVEAGHFEALVLTNGSHPLVQIS